MQEETRVHVDDSCVCDSITTVTHTAGTCVFTSCNVQKTNPKTGEVSDTPVSMMDVYQEFDQLSEKFKIMKFKSKVSVWNVERKSMKPCFIWVRLFLLAERGEKLRF